MSNPKRHEENANADLQRRYIERTRALEDERRALSADLRTLLTDDNAHELHNGQISEIMSRLDDIESTQASNAVILADMLATYTDQ